MNAAEPISAMAKGDRRPLPGILVVGAALLGFWIVVAAAAPLIVPYDPLQIDLRAFLAPPAADHWFGTDNVGRDVFSRTVYGVRIALYIGCIGVIAPLVIGTLIGLLAGYFGGWTDMLLMRIVDMTVPFPFFVLVLAIVAALGPGISNYFIALALVGWVPYARLVRAEVMVLKNADFVLAARTLGFPAPYILLRHVLPNAISPVIVYVMTDVVLIILFGASLGFLGMGAQPPMAEWGIMIAEGQAYLSTAWWIAFFPGCAAVLLGIAFAFVGDGLAKFLRVER